MAQFHYQNNIIYLSQGEEKQINDAQCYAAAKKILQEFVNNYNMGKRKENQIQFSTTQPVPGSWSLHYDEYQKQLDQQPKEYSCLILPKNIPMKTLENLFDNIKDWVDQAKGYLGFSYTVIKDQSHPLFYHEEYGYPIYCKAIELYSTSERLREQLIKSIEREKASAKAVIKAGLSAQPSSPKEQSESDIDDAKKAIEAPRKVIGNSR